MMIQISGKSAHLAQKMLVLSKKNAKKQSWKLSKGKFWRKPRMQNNAHLNH